MPSLLRFEGRTQEEARRRIREALGGDARIVRAGKERSGGVFGFFQREVFVFEVERPEPSPRTERDHTSEPALASLLAAAIDQTESTLHLGDPADRAGHFATSFEEVLSEAEATIATARTGNAQPPSVADVAEAGCYDRPEGVARPAHVDSLQFPHAADHPDAAEHAGASPAPRGASVAADSPPERPPSGGESSSPPREWSDLADPLAASGRSGELSELLAGITLIPPPALPVDRGSLVLVLGRRPGVDRLARALAERTGDPADRLVFATLRSDGCSVPCPTTTGRRRVSLNPLALAQLVAARRIDGRSTVLAVTTPSRGAPAIADLVAALRPDACWAAISSQQARNELDGLTQATGRLDAIALDGFVECPDPLDALRAEVPIAYIDGHRASQLMIAALLSEHLEGRTS